MNPAPIPWILCGPRFPPDRTGDPEGSTATIRVFRPRDLKWVPTPVMVPPVPTPEMKASGSGMSAKISLAVVSRCIFGFAGLSNCSGMKFLGSASHIALALVTAPGMPSGPGVRTSFAPRAANNFLRSTEKVSGMQRTNS